MKVKVKDGSESGSEGCESDVKDGSESGGEGSEGVKEGREVK